jgi:hypothetical protein
MAMGLLVNIAEDVTIEKKMQKCNLVVFISPDFSRV